MSYDQPSPRDGLTPLASTRLGAVLPASALAITKDQLHGNALRSLKVGAGTARLVEASSQQGIRLLPVKGVALAAQVYENPQSRAPGDLDFLIAGADYPKAAELLESNGYVPDSPPRMDVRRERAWHHFKGERHFFNDDGLFDLDLHWRLFDERFIPLDFESLWRRSASVSLRGRTVPVPCVEDHLVILCVHGSKHGWDTLKWVVDVAELLRSHPDLEWPVVLERAESMHARLMLLLGLALANRLLDAKLQSGMQKEIEEEPAVEGFYSVACARLLHRLEVPEENMAAALAQVGAAVAPGTRRSIQKERSLDQRYRLAPVWVNRRLLLHQERPFWEGARLALANALTPGAREIEMVALPRPFFFVYHGLRLLRLAVQSGVRSARRIGERTTHLPEAPRATTSVIP